MRGEHTSHPMSLRGVRGSSPHARGAPLAAVRHRLERGIVPACAGSTSATAMPAGCLGDHSRMRGEHKADYPRHPVVKGSSPHARGAHTSQHQLRGPISESSPHARGAPCRACPGGIIPACAGSTEVERLRAAASADHPHMRGEHFLHGAACGSAAGSSPHARGAPVQVRFSNGMVGIIPACAGSTARTRGGPRPWRDHPRIRGEHAVPASEPFKPWGSSPHARRSLRKVHAGGRRQGIIPACAGSTAQGPCRRPPPRDHPRMRGEHVEVEVKSRSFAGSSPHTRGAHIPLDADAQVMGIIPACAGNTPPIAA